MKHDHLTLITALCLPAAPALAETLIVPSESYPTIQEAIGSAQVGDVVLVGPGTYYEELDFDGTSIRLQGAGGGSTVLDGSIGSGHEPGIKIITDTTDLPYEIHDFTFQNWGVETGGDPVIYFSGEAPLVIQDCVFTGNDSGNSYPGYQWPSAIHAGGKCRLDLQRCSFANNQGLGGVVKISDGTAIGITDCDFTDNSSRALYVNAVSNDVTLAIDGCSFINNIGDAFSGEGCGNIPGGGGVAVSHYQDPITATITDCLFEGNIGCQGGGFSGLSVGTMDNCTFRNNTARFGGGAMWGAPTLITNCLFEGNTVEGNTASNGGAIFGSPETLSNCVFRSNSVPEDGSGGAIYGEANLTDCTFANNSAGYSGGAVYGNTGDWSVTGCTFTGNTASSYGGALRSRSSGDIVNCTFSGNVTDGNGGAVWQRFLSPGSSISGCVFSNNAATDGGALYVLGGYDQPHILDSSFCQNDPEHISGYWIDDGGNNFLDVCDDTCQSDVTNDGVVDGNDIIETINTWGPCTGCSADVNGDDAVDVLDLLTILTAWGTCP